MVPKKSLADARVRTALVVAPTGWGSVGDDALIRGSLLTLRAQGFDVILLTGSDRAQWETAFTGLDIRIIEPKQLVSLLILFKIALLDHVYVIGADIMDGGYGNKSSLRRLMLARVMSLLGKRVSVISFSFNKKPTQEVIDAFRRLGNRVRFALRDPHSRQRFQQTTGLNAELVADIGFLAQPVTTPQVDEFTEWAKRTKADGNELLFVNINIGTFRCNPLASRSSPEQIVGAMHAALHDLRHRHGVRFSIAVVPHDFREAGAPWSDVSLAQALLSRLQEDFDGAVRMVPIPFNSAEMCAMAKHASLVLSGRMHLAILSIAAGVAPISLTYQDKFEGMYQHVFEDASGLMLPSDLMMNNPAAVSNALMAGLFRRERLAAEISGSRRRVILMAEGNFTEMAS